MQRLLVVDGNSLGHFAQNGQKLTLGDMPVHAIYNFLRTMHAKLAAHAMYEPIVLWDGISWRNSVFPDYKENRKAEETPHEKAQMESRREYNKQRPHIQKALSLLGVRQMQAMNMEADDLAAILTDRIMQRDPSARVVLYTRDQDWLQIVQPGVTWMNLDGEKVTVDNFEERTGVASVKQFVEMKALMGDTGDNISGVGGIAEKGAQTFLKTFGSLEQFLNMAIIEKTLDLSKVPAKFRALAEDEDKAFIFARNVSLMDLRHSARPKPVDLSSERGECDLAKFKRFCEILLFKSILTQFDNWVSVFPAGKAALMEAQNVA